MILHASMSMPMWFGEEHLNILYLVCELRKLNLSEEENKIKRDTILSVKCQCWFGSHVSGVNAICKIKCSDITLLYRCC